jgi:hypothetical protein
MAVTKWSIVAKTKPTRLVGLFGVVLIILGVTADRIT